MNKNTREIFLAWLKRQAKGNRRLAIWTDGHSILSYDTTLVSRDRSVVSPDDDDVIINMTRYSNTTTRHQNSLMVLLTSLKEKAKRYKNLSVIRPIDALIKVDGLPVKNGSITIRKPRRKS